MQLTRGMTALISGASSGIGEAFSQALAARGINVVLVARSEQRLATLAAQLTDLHGVQTTVIASDLAVHSAPATVADQATGTSDHSDRIPLRASIPHRKNHRRQRSPDPGGASLGQNGVLARRAAPRAGACAVEVQEIESDQARRPERTGDSRAGPIWLGCTQERRDLP